MTKPTSVEPPQTCRKLRGRGSSPWATCFFFSHFNKLFLTFMAFFGNMVWWNSSMVRFVFNNEAQRRERRSEVTPPRVWFTTESPHQGLAICHRGNRQLFTAIYKVNTFQSFLGSTTATSASMDRAGASLLGEATERCLITVQGRCCTQKIIKTLKVLTPPSGIKKKKKRRRGKSTRNKGGRGKKKYSELKAAIAIPVHTTWTYISSPSSPEVFLFSGWEVFLTSPQRQHQKKWAYCVPCVVLLSW